MDHKLKCNALKCRKEVNDHAVVTTCCHVFCIDCANRSQLSGHHEVRRQICPACDTQLTNPDDVVIANLKPTEDYKTSVLSGLNPNVIMECTGRALNFWAYQTLQEIIYQEYVAKSFSDKNAILNLQMDKVVHDANVQLSHLRNTLSEMQADQSNLRRKNEELSQVVHEKSRTLLHTQDLYDKLKHRVMLGQVHDAASDAATDTVQAPPTANRYVDRAGAENQRSTSLPLCQSVQDGLIQNPGGSLDTEMNMGPPPISRSGIVDRTWSGSQVNGPRNEPIQTISSHRQRLNRNSAPTPRMGLSNSQSNRMPGPLIPPHRLSPSARNPLSNLHANSAAGPGFAGYGMSAGLKVSNPAGSVTNGIERPVMRSRVAQRPGSGFPTNRTLAFGPVPAANMFSNGDTYY